MELIFNKIDGRLRRVARNGRDYLVAPLSMIVPGVLKGSQGALLYPIDEVSRDPDKWNGTPIVLYHPQVNGQHVSARDPDIIESQGLGTVYKTNCNGKLHAEGWFDVENVRRADRRFKTNVLDRLQKGEPIELSTGLFTDNWPAPDGSTFNGEPYNFTARNYRPDHLAILPDQRGACSVDDGCGVNINEQMQAYEETCNDDDDDGCGTENQKQPKQPKSADGQSASGSAAAATKIAKTKALTNEQGIVNRFWDWLTANDGKYRNPQSQSSGKFKRHGAGTGKGDAHEAAQRGHVQLTDRQSELGKDAKTQAEAGHNPPSWVTDESKWDRAKEAADKGGYSDDTYYAVVTHIYENMGGGIGSGSTENSLTEEVEMGLTAPQREGIVNFLVTNCSCWKDKDGRTVLNSMSDQRLQMLKEEQDAFKKLKVRAPVTVNAYGGNDDDDDDEEDDDDDDVENKAKVPPDMHGDNPADNAFPPKKGKLKGGHAAPMDPHAADGGDPKSSHLQNRAQDDFAKSLGFKSVAHAKAVLNHAKGVELKARQAFAGKLVANIADDQRRAKRFTYYVENFNLQQLQEMVADMPTVNESPAEEIEVPTFVGAGGGPSFTSNSQTDVNDVLPLPTMNYEQPQRNAVNG